MAVYIEWYWQLFYIIVPTVGIVTNSLIVYVTVVDRRLRSPCNIMIAMIAFGDVFHQLGQYVMVISHNMVPEHVIPQRICMHLQAAPLFGLCFSSVIVLCVAFDRILAIKDIYFFPQTYPKLYIIIHSTPAVLFSTMFVVWSYLLLDERNVTCGIPDVLTDDAYNACFGSIIVINVLLIICYSYMLHSLRSVVSRDVRMRSILRTLLLITMTVVFGWFSTNLIRFGAEFLQIRFQHRIGLDLTAGVFVHISIATNFLIYYFISSDYREVFNKRLFTKYLKRKFRISAVSKWIVFDPSKENATASMEELEKILLEGSKENGRYSQISHKQRNEQLFRQFRSDDHCSTLRSSHNSK